MKDLIWLVFTRCRDMNVHLASATCTPSIYAPSASVSANLQSFSPSSAIIADIVLLQVGICVPVDQLVESTTASGRMRLGPSKNSRVNPHLVVALKAIPVRDPTSINRTLAISNLLAYCLAEILKLQAMCIYQFMESLLPRHATYVSMLAVQFQ